MAKTVLKIQGMDCAEEVAVLKHQLGPLVGGEEQLTFDILNGKLFVESNEADIPVESMIQAVARTGMRAEVWHGEDQANRELGFMAWHGRTVFTVASGIFGLGGFLTHVWMADGVRAALGSEGMGV